MNITLPTAKHTAQGPYLGFALQPVRLCTQLLKCPDGAQVSLELLDDVAVHAADGSVEVEQIKSATRQNPTSDWSDELWKTFANWLDALAAGQLTIGQTRFTLYVTPPRTGEWAQALSNASTDGEVEEIVAAIEAKLNRLRAPKACDANLKRFGVVIDTIEGQKMLARRAPGDQQSTGDMVLIEGPQVDVPDRIEGKNVNLDTVKASLNRLAGLTNLGFDPTAEDGSKARPSFRDLMAFTFQPQNIVANPDVMFFKADTNEHREKLKTIFPYVLNAVTGEVLQARYELDQLNRILRRKEAELRTLVAANTAWQVEALAWLRQAVELGLLPADQGLSGDWSTILDILRGVATSKRTNARPSLAGIDVTLSRLEELRTQEAGQAAELADHRQRLNELRRLRESADAYGSSMHIQRDRLAIARWLRGLTESERTDELVSVGRGGHDELITLCDNLEAIEVKLRAQPTLSDMLDKETLRLRSGTEEVLTALNETRTEIANLERTSEAAQAATDHFDRTERFLGRVEQALTLYDRADQSSSLRNEIGVLSGRIQELQRRISEAGIQRKLRNALTQVESSANRFVPRLDAEWPDAPIQLVIEELTIKVVRGTRSDFLWEIGSGANWLAYHVATTLALQEFFLRYIIQYLDC